MTCVLIVTIDTEEERVWGARYAPNGHTVENVAGISRFQALCDRFGIRPTYLVDAPVVQDASAVRLLRPLQDAGRCEIGAHVHPWCNPPNTQPCDGRTSYLCNWPAAQQRDMLAWLTNAIRKQFDRAPTSFRAGRYGLDIVGARILADLGYQVDSSVVPFTDYSVAGGPDFSTAPHRPYYVGGDDLCRPEPAGKLLEVPVSVGFNRKNFSRAHALQQAIRRAGLSPLRLEGLLDRLNLVRRIKFSPEQSGERRMKQLAEAYLRQQAPAIVLMFHSSSLMPGYSPYVRTPADLERFYRRLESVFEYCMIHRSMTNSPLSEFARAWRDGNSAGVRASDAPAAGGGTVHAQYS
jgi:hypothetical protein